MTQMSTPYPTYPPGGPPPPPAPIGRPDRVGAVVSAVVGVVSLAATVAVVALTSDEVPGTDLLADADSAPAISGPSGQTPDGSAVPLAELRQSFPLPPGTGPSNLDPDVLVRGTRAYDVRAPLAVVQAFYVRRLPELGYVWTEPLPSTTNGRISGWHGSIVRRDELPIVGYLSIDRNLFGVGPGVVTIQVSLDE